MPVKACMPFCFQNWRRSSRQKQQCAGIFHRGFGSLLALRRCDADLSAARAGCRGALLACHLSDWRPSCEYTANSLSTNQFELIEDMWRVLSSCWKCPSEDGPTTRLEVVVSKTMLIWCQGRQNCAHNNPPHFYNTRSRPDCWYKAQWMWAFMLSTLKSDTSKRMLQ